MIVSENPLYEIPATIRFWVDVLTITLSVLGFLAASGIWLMRQSVVTHKALAETLEPIGLQVDQHGARITQLEGDLAHMPDGGEWIDLRERMTRLEGGIEKIETQVSSIHETMERIERPLNVLIDEKLKARHQ